MIQFSSLLHAIQTCHGFVDCQERGASGVPKAKRRVLGSLSRLASSHLTNRYSSRTEVELQLAGWNCDHVMVYRDHGCGSLATELDVPALQ